MMNRPTRGYSLLELIVSVGIFSIIMLVVTGAYLTLIDLDRQARSGNQLAATLSFAVESMARNIRTGTDYACNGNLSNPDCTAVPASKFSFLDNQGQRIVYQLKSDGSIGQCTNSDPDDSNCLTSNAVSLTDPRITIQSLDFFVRGASVTDEIQPQVTISISGTMKTGAQTTTDFTIQTGATQRLIDL